MDLQTSRTVTTTASNSRQDSRLKTARRVPDVNHTQNPVEVAEISIVGGGAASTSGLSDTCTDRGGLSPNREWGLLNFIRQDVGMTTTSACFGSIWHKPLLKRIWSMLGMPCLSESPNAMSDAQEAAEREGSMADKCRPAPVKRAYWHSLQAFPPCYSDIFYSRLFPACLQIRFPSAAR